MLNSHYALDAYDNVVFDGFLSNRKRENYECSVLLRIVGLFAFGCILVRFSIKLNFDSKLPVMITNMGLVHYTLLGLFGVHSISK